MSYAWRALQQVIKESDILFEVLDARMPELSRNESVEEVINDSGKEMAFILNKADLISKSQAENAAKNLKTQTGKEVFIVSVKGKTGTKGLRKALYSLADKSEFTKLRVGFVGYPNTGKSSVINALAFKKKVEVTSKAGTTRGIQWAAIGERLLINDSPGIIPLRKYDEIRYALIGAKDISKIKDLEIVASYIVSMFIKSESTKKILEKFYDLKIPDNITDPEEILELIGKRKGFMKRGGEYDENRVSKSIIKNWQEGKLRF